MPRPALVDRAPDVAALRRLASSGRKQLAVLSGRRQVGKTYLLRHTWPSGRVFRFQAAALTSDLNRQDLLREMASQTTLGIVPEDYPNWRTTFRALADLARAEPSVVILDEFQYLLADGDAVPSQLAAIWDDLPDDLPLTIVLCGSEVSAMEHLSEGGAPLYGRVTWTRSLPPFDYYDAAAMASWLPPRDAASLYGILGGMPRYLAALDDEEPLDAAITRVFIASGGAVRSQMASLIEQERAIRQPAEYRSVLEAVAGGRTVLAEIVNRTGLADHVARRALKTLAALSLVAEERNFDAPASAPVRYRVTDNAVAFWHHFLVPQRTRLSMDPPERFWTSRVVPSLDAYLGHRFEAIVRQAYGRFHASWGLQPVEQWARWEGQARDRSSVEIDIAARQADGRLLTGEIKWSSSPIGPSVHIALADKLARLAISGQSWARLADDAMFLYASAAGFAPEMRQFARANSRIHLVDLAHLYPKAASERPPAAKATGRRP